MTNLDGCLALVTGASRGIGEECARALANAGARVALSGRDVAALEQVAGELPGEPVVLPADLAERGAATGLGKQAIDSLGGLDVLVNNAGITMIRDSLELTESDIDEVLAINVRSVLTLSAAVAPAMIERGGGSIINMSSLVSVVGASYQAAYAASKGALDAVTRSHALDWGKHGIRVNSIAPGVVVTDIWRGAREIPGLIEAIEAKIALGRWGETDDVADVVVFLASDQARYITAQTISVDGGMAHVMDLTAGFFD